MSSKKGLSILSIMANTVAMIIGLGFLYVLFKGFLFTFTVTFLIVLVLSYLGSRIIVNRAKLDKRAGYVVLAQSLVISLLLTVIL